MTDKKSGSPAEATIRPLSGDDIDRVIAIDRKLSGRSRRGFFQSRLAAALREPSGFIYVGVCEGETLSGFAMARLQAGDFGMETSVAVLDAIGVDPESQSTGLGRKLLAGIEDIMRQKGIREIHSQLDWNNHAMMRFLDAAGFQMAPRTVLSRTTTAMETF